MKLKSIKIENYKSLKNVEISNLGNLVAFIGPNMAGKSNIFEPLWFVHEGAIESLKHAIETRTQTRSYKDIVWRRDSNEVIKINLLFTMSSEFRDDLLNPLIRTEEFPEESRIYNSDFLKELHYELDFSMRQPNPHYIEKLLTANIDSNKLSLIIVKKSFNLQTRQCDSRINSCESQFKRILKSDSAKFVEDFQRSSSSTSFDDSLKLAFYNEYHSGLKGLEEKILGRFIQYIRSIKWLSPYHNIQNEIAISGETSLKSDSSNLANIIHILSSNYPSKFARTLPLLKSVIPGIERISTPVIRNATTIGLEEVEQLSIVHKLSNFSAGTKNTLSIIALLLTSEDEELILIEEPEIHLHPSGVRKLIDILQDYSSNRQILITTHSPTALLNFNIDNVYLVKRNNEKNTQITVVTPDTAFEVIEQLGIRPSDLLDYDVIIFVEGCFDKDIFNEFAKKMNIDTNGICFISTWGWSNMKYFANTSILQRRRVLTNIIGVFDGDIDRRPKAKKEKENMLSKMNVPKENIFNLSKGEIECYLLDEEAWFKTWPVLEGKIAKDELGVRFQEIIDSDQQKEDMERLMEEFGLGRYDREVAVKLVKSIDSIPTDIEVVLNHTKLIINQDG